MALYRSLRWLFGGVLGVGGSLVIPREATLVLAAGLVALAVALVVTLFFEAPSRRLRLLVREMRRMSPRAPV